MATGERSIVFVSDFGFNEWVGICHAVMSRVAPRSPVVDLSHLVAALNVSAGALLVVDSLPYLAEDAVIVAVVDPSVGADRDLAIETSAGRLLVGPDNGLLSLAWAADGGIRTAVEITSDDVVLRPVAPSFHARDVLCPAAAHLAVGKPIEELGPPVDVASLATVSIPVPEIERGKIRCKVVDFNRFGNIQLNVREQHFEEAGLNRTPGVAVEAVSGSAHAKYGETYADFGAGEYGVMFDQRGWLLVVRGNPASALEGLGVQIGDPVWLTGESVDGG